MKVKILKWILLFAKPFFYETRLSKNGTSPENASWDLAKQLFWILK